MRKFSATKGDIEELSDVNITPLTDLSLTLLIIADAHKPYDGAVYDKCYVLNRGSKPGEGRP